MSNNLKTNPIIIDTFDADFVVSADPITVKKVVLFSAAATDKFSLLHGVADTAPECIRVKQGADLNAAVDFNSGAHIFPNGLFFDASAINAGLDNTTDRVLIYLK